MIADDKGKDDDLFARAIKALESLRIGQKEPASEVMANAYYNHASEYSWRKLPRRKLPTCWTCKRVGHMHRECDSRRKAFMSHQRHSRQRGRFIPPHNRSQGYSNNAWLGRQYR